MASKRISLSKKQLTLKNVALVALTSSDRAQNLHALQVDQILPSHEALVFVIPSILQHSRRGSLESKIVCMSWDSPELNVEDYVLFYMSNTLKYSPKNMEKRIKKT